jgi:signal transduction histidine kinase
MEITMLALNRCVPPAEPVAWLRLALVGAIVIPAIFVVIVMVGAYQTAKDSTIQSLCQTADTAFEVTNDSLQLLHALVESAESQFRAVVSITPGESVATAMRAEVMKLTDRIADYASIKIYTLDRNLIAASEQTVTPDSMLYRGAIPPVGEIGIDDVRFLTRSQPNVINFTQKFVDASNPKNSNLIVVTIKPNYFNALGRDRPLGDQIITLRRADGRIVMRIPNADPLRFTPSPTAFADAVATNTGQGIYYVTGLQDGVHRVGTYRLVRGYDLYVVVTAPDSVNVQMWLTLAAPYIGCLVALQFLGTTIAWSALKQARLAAEQAHLVETERAMRNQFVGAAQAKGRYELLSVISAGIAHHFNNILATLNISHELIELRANVANIRTALDAAIAASERGKLLVRHLQAFSLNLPVKPQVIDLKQVFPEIIEALRTTVFADGEVTVILTVEPNIGSVEVDPTEFRFAMFNIASNSKEYMDKGGEFKADLRTLRFFQPGFQVGDDRIEGTFACISLEDNGSGISPENIDKVFTPFFTTKDVGEGGGGLGLSHVYGFVKSCNGAISVESTPGAGTTIKIYLPIKR